ncbi:arabinogalactan oligomer/maltooligosaccharide transport system permease protein [Paenibacillus anaericanus]|uniref:sugar ABC transporter permease n=1 Tax=Paenibacillus anaericanus TaxID=170367 RepID=UPI00278AB8D7|nr:sugar ABC transporter permease [Paenibacillus anaericanus]MDQ0090277.1 arabinogalactan oligomer/maltooligosaccharide transport system permease protein [Paenibacillus anaericanus]
MSAKMKSRLEVGGIYLAILIMFLVILYPLIWVFGISLNPGTSMYSATIIPKNASLEHYKWLFTNIDSDYLLWYKNTLIVASAKTVLSLIVTLAIAYAFSRYNFIGRKNGLYVLMLIKIFPVLMGMVAIYILLNMVGLLDSLVGLTLVYVGTSIPMHAFLVKGYFDTIPRDLDEAAKIDGAGHLRIFFQIILPLAMPIIAVVSLFNFMAPFMDFLLPRIVIRSPENYTLALGLYNLVNQEFGRNFTRFAAGSMLIAVPIATVFLYFQRYLISGLTAGASKS